MQCIPVATLRYACMTTIDLNADLGEGEPTDEALLGLVSSCNVACGGHTGDDESMAATVQLALDNDVVIGAHPSYPDREGFGRVSGYLRGDELAASLSGQVARLAGIAARLGARIRHVKPHGALYNDACGDGELADTVAATVAGLDNGYALVGQPGSALAESAARRGLDFIAEGFVDRRYEADGSLTPRSEPDAVHKDIDAIAAQAVSLAVDRRVFSRRGDRVDVAADTLCIHGDTPHAVEAARAVRDALAAAGVEIRPAASA